MSTRQHISRKASLQSNFTPTVNPLKTRGFGKGIQARSAELPKTNPLQTRPFGSPIPASAQQEETQSASEQLEIESHLGYNGLNVPVNAPATPPPPVQRKSASGGLENQTKLTTVAQREIIQRDGEIERSVNSIDLSQIAPNANKIKEAAAKIVDVATTVREDGTHWYGDEKDKLNMAANLTDMASKMMSAASAMENITRGLDGGKLEGSAEVLDKATKLLRAADFIASLDPNHPSLVAFQNDPDDFTKAADWANHIGDVFGKASGLIPDSIPGLPGFIPQYFKGLLSAPKNYVQVFIALQQDRINRIDSETGGSSADTRVTDGATTFWEGPLSHLFYDAYFVKPPGLQEFMHQNRYIAGVDLWETSESYGKALILGAVQGISDDDKRQLWSNYINGS